MPRKCTVCVHHDLVKINGRLVGGKEALRKIAEQYDLSTTALYRHKKEHLPAQLALAKNAKDLADADTVIRQLGEFKERAMLLYDACDRYLRDPEDPTRYDVGPRDHDIEVIYTEYIGTPPKPVKRRALLSELLLDKTGKDVVSTRYKIADPRELILKTAGILNAQLEIIGRITGELKGMQVNTQNNMQLNFNAHILEQWDVWKQIIFHTLQPFPEAKIALAKALVAEEKTRATLGN